MLTVKGKLNMAEYHEILRKRTEAAMLPMTSSEFEADGQDESFSGKAMTSTSGNDCSQFVDDGSQHGRSHLHGYNSPQFPDFQTIYDLYKETR